MINNPSISVVPKFAVVGHPNKGKSSIVATLANDDRVSISATPGTTTKSQTFPMKVDGKLLYELIDTPGFQRAHDVLIWLSEIAQTNGWGANERFKALQAFLESDECKSKYTDEWQLLSPIMNGSGILYVVDGSRPYGREYEAEMEILRWTGRPSMALINQIGPDDFSEQWQRALGQYFKIVRHFNPIELEWTKRLSLLRAFGEIHQPWRDSLDLAISHLERLKSNQASQCAEIIASSIIAMMGLRLKIKLGQHDHINEEKESLSLHYFNKVRAIESQCHQKILAIYHHENLDANMESISGLHLDLFSEQGWSLFGFNNKELLMTGMAGGAAAGGVFDAAVGGASLLAGAGIGALVGGASVLLSQNKMANIKIMRLPFGEKFLRIGPIKNLNFPYVILSRALTLHKIVSERTHGNQKRLNFAKDSAPTQLINEGSRKELEKVFSELRKSDVDIQSKTPILTRLILVLV